MTAAIIKSPMEGDMLSRRTLSCLAFFVVFCGNLLASNVDDLKPDADALAVSVYTGPSMSTLRELTDGVGGRLTGGPAYAKAADWAMEKFRTYGLTNVHVEPFTMPNG